MRSSELRSSAAFCSVGDRARGEIEREVGRAGRARAVIRDRPQPAHRLLQERRRRHENRAAAEIERLQQVPDQPHVVVDRQPAHEIGRFVVAERLADHPLVGEQVAVRDDDALGLAGRARGVLQERDGVAIERRRLPPGAARAIRLVRAEDRPVPAAEPRVDPLPRVGHRQDDARAGVGENRVDARQVARVARRIRGHGHHARREAREEGDDEFAGLAERAAARGRRAPRDRRRARPRRRRARRAPRSSGARRRARRRRGSSGTDDRPDAPRATSGRR